MGTIFSVNQIFKNLASIGVVVTLCSFVRLYVYYSKYDVDIIPLIDLSEVPKYGIDLFVTAFIMISVFFSCLAYGAIKNRTTVFFGLFIENPSRKFLFISIATPIAGLAMYKSYSAIHNIIGNWTGYYIFTGLTGLIILCNIIITLSLTKEDFIKADLVSLKSFVPIFLLANLISFSVVLGCFQGSTFSDRPLVVFLYNDKTIVKSAPNFYCIGTTNKYLFMRNEESRITCVYNLDKISYLHNFKDMSKMIHKDYKYPPTLK